MMHKANYSTNLTEKQLQVIEKLLENKTRKRKHSIAEIINAIYYLLKTGCQWRMLPLNFLKWQLVYYYYNKWKNEGTFEEINDILRDTVRIEQENVIRHDFIIHALSQASGDCLKSKLLLEFAAMHFPDRVTEIKQQCNEAYRKKHERIEERILQLQPYDNETTEEAAAGEEGQQAKALPAPESAETEGEGTSAPDVETGTGENAPEPETFENPDTDDLPLYPGLPEQAEIGEIPDDDGEIQEAVYEEIAA